MMRRLQAAALGGAMLLLAGGASAQQFSGGIPAGWNCIGTCGALGANGVVTLAPGGGSQYGYVTTYNSTASANLPGVGGEGSATTGSLLRSTAISLNVGQTLSFNFNYITSDGAGYADYAWARLLNASDLSEAALLFTARTTPGGNTVPGFGMPAPEATIVPANTEIIAGAPVWAGLGDSSGTCWSTGCGYTGWILSQFVLASSGSYILEFGVTNWNDTAFQSGMAFDGLAIDGTPIGSVVPEPISMVLLGSGLAGVAAARRRRRREEESEEI